MDEDARARLLRPRTGERHPVVAGWLTVVLTGFGHMYMREYARGFVLLVSDMAALGALEELTTGRDPVLGLTWPQLAVWVVFLVFAVVDAPRASTPPRPVRGVIWAFPAIAVLALAARALA